MKGINAMSYAVIPITPAGDTCVFSKCLMHTPDWISFTQDTQLTLTRNGTYLIYYYAFSDDVYLSMSILLNGREIHTTYDLGYEICAGAVSIVYNAPQTVALKNYSNPQVTFPGFLMIAKF